jgi:hypothetical protein
MKKLLMTAVAGLATTLVPLSAFADSSTEQYAHYEGTLQPRTNRDHRDRYVSTITLTGDQGSSGTVTDLPTSTSTNPRNVWQDKTSVIISVISGETLTVDCTAGNGGSMYKYFYIDYNNDGTFDVDGGELVAQTSTGGNYVKDSTSTANNPLPSFTLPDLAVGKYRCRFKIDYASTDPYGRTDSSDPIYQNGGEIIDFLIEVPSTTPTLSFAQPTGGTLEVKNAEGTALENGAELEDGTVLTIVATPDADHLSGTVTANGTALTANEDGTYTYTTSGSTTIAATFTEKYAHPEGELNPTNSNYNTRKGRYVSSITFTGSTGSTQTISDNLPESSENSNRNVWQDKTKLDPTADFIPGETITITAKGGGSWINTYVYIDYNNDGIFTVNYDEATHKIKDGSELVAFNAYSSDGTNVYNSNAETSYGYLGPTLTSSEGHMPTFTIPANLAPGKYRVRYKLDWYNLDAYGSADIATDVCGEIVDFYINVVKTEHTVTIEQADGGSISVTKDGETVNSNDVVNSGEKLKIAVSPKDDYLVKAVTVNGDAISADADGYYYYTVDGVDFTIAAEFVLKSEYKLTVNFAQPTEGGKIVVKADGAEIESGAEIAYETPITIEATPNTFAWQVGSITLNGSALDADNDAYTFTLTEDATIAATFETKYTHNDATIKMESVQNTNRSVFGITLTNEKNVERGKVSLTEISEGDTRALWQDMTAQSIKVCPGDVLTISVKGMGCDLGEYLYIDWNNNYKFECQYEAGKDLVTNYPSNELVSYNMDRINGNFYNSKGETVDRTNNTEGLIDGPYFYLPSFTVPNVEPGKYYARFKIDWADNDPDKAGTGCAGEIIDFVIEVENEHTVSVAVPETNQKYGNVKIVGGTENATSINTLTDVTVEAEATGYAISFMCWTDDAGNIVSKDTQYTYTGNENSTLTAHFGYKVWGQVNGNGKLTFSKEKKYELAANLGKKKSAPAFASDEETESNSTTTTDNGVDPTVTLNASVGDNLDDMTLTATDDNGTAGLFEAGKTLYVNTKADGSQKIGLVYVINSISQTIVKEYNYTDDDDVNALSLELDMAIPYDVSVYYYDNIATGVEDIAVDAEAEAEYYNLNGVRVTGDLVPGVYIRRAADKTEKVIIK